MRSVGFILLFGMFLNANTAIASRVYRRNAVSDDLLVRVTPKDPLFRCSDRARPTQEQCIKERSYAYNEKCITTNELALLTQYNGCPVCVEGRYRGWCPVGCFVRGTKILVQDRENESVSWTPVEEIIAHSSRYLVASWLAGSNVSSPQFQYLPIRLTTVGPEEEPLVMISTAGERTLGLTSVHAVTLADGRLVAAESLKVGDRLISIDGSIDMITEISRPYTEDLVFNLSVEIDEDQSHLILAEGLLVGDQFLQDSPFLNSTFLN